MSVTSLYFFCAFALSLGIYYIIPKKYQWCALTGFSVFFFIASCDWRTGIYFFINAMVTWFVACQIIKRRERQEETIAKRYMLLGLFINVGMLAVLKYSNFVVYNWNVFASFIKSDCRLAEFHFLMPIGISFYTLISVGYILDVYWEITEAEKNPFKVMLFVGYFPQMTSGPISRYEEVREQLFGEHSFDYERVTFGLQRMLWGIFKKLVISTRAAILVDVIYGDPVAYRGLYIWIAASLFMLQLYTDFSGCMDIILGVSECYGIRLPENFRTPFFSRSVQEFWQRWHITLGAWLKNYILFPILRTHTWRKLTKWLKIHVSKKASKQLPAYLGMLCVWLLIGLWHGGGWKYILGQGVWFWLCIVLEQVLEPVFKKITGVLGITRDNFGYHLFQSLRVFLFVSIGDMFFRLDGISATIAEIKSGITVLNPWIFFDGSFVDMGLTYRDMNILLLGILLLFIVAILQEKYGEARKWMKEQFLPFRWLVWIFLFLFVLINGSYGPGYSAADFIYRGF